MNFVNKRLKTLPGLNFSKITKQNSIKDGFKFVLYYSSELYINRLPDCIVYVKKDSTRKNFF